MFSEYKTHHKPLYNKLVELSRNIFFYKKVKLKDNFETRINLVFIHLSLILIGIKKIKIYLTLKNNIIHIYLVMNYLLKILNLKIVKNIFFLKNKFKSLENLKAVKLRVILFYI